MRSSIGRSATRRDQATPASRRGALLVACAAVCWSSGGLIARLVTTSPWTTSLWRSLFASLFLVVVLWIARRRSILAQWRDGGRPVVAVAVCMALASTCFLFSLAHTSVANTLILISTGPYVAGLLGWLWLGERARRHAGDRARPALGLARPERAARRGDVDGRRPHPGGAAREHAPGRRYPRNSSQVSSHA